MSKGWLFPDEAPNCEPVPLEWQQDTRLVESLFISEKKRQYNEGLKKTLWLKTQLKRGGAALTQL